MKPAIIKIKGLPSETKERFKNIAKNRGESMSSILKHHIYELLASTPEHMKRARID